MVVSTRAGSASAEMKRQARVATLVLVERVEIFRPKNQSQSVSEDATTDILFMLFAVVSMYRITKSQGTSGDLLIQPTC